MSPKQAPQNAPEISEIGTPYSSQVAAAAAAIDASRQQQAALASAQQIANPEASKKYLQYLQSQQSQQPVKPAIQPPVALRAPEPVAIKLESFASPEAELSRKAAALFSINGSNLLAGGVYAPAGLIKYFAANNIDSSKPIDVKFLNKGHTSLTMVKNAQGAYTATFHINMKELGLPYDRNAPNSGLPLNRYYGDEQSAQSCAAYSECLAKVVGSMVRETLTYQYKHDRAWAQEIDKRYGRKKYLHEMSAAMVRQIASSTEYGRENNATDALNYPTLCTNQAFGNTAAMKLGNPRFSRSEGSAGSIVVAQSLTGALMDFGDSIASYSVAQNVSTTSHEQGVSKHPSGRRRHHTS